MKTRWLSLAVVALAACSLTAAAADWPQWRGPERNGISRETGLLDNWPEAGPKLLWQAKDIGTGYSTPAVVGERLYLLSNEGIEDEFVQARNVSDGGEVWSTRIGKVGNPNQRPSYPGARSTPTVDGRFLYALGSDGDLACIETDTGRIRWARNVQTDFAGKHGEWAYAESPLVDGDVVVCTPGGSEATIVALNKMTGEVVWKCPVPGGDEAAYASAIIVEVDGLKQYVQFLGKGLVGVDAETGKFLWRYDRTAEGSQANIPTPLAHEGYVYSATGRGGAALVEIQVNGKDVETQEVYFSTRLPEGIGGAVRIGDDLYGSNDQGMICADFTTGDIKWQDRAIGPCSVCYADGCLYLHSERSGEVALIEAAPEAYREKGRFTPPDPPKLGTGRGQPRSWAYPVVANGRLYIRNWNRLWCYDIQE